MTAPPTATAAATGVDERTAADGSPTTTEPDLPAGPSWRRAAGWCGVAVIAVLVTLLVVDNFVVVELRFGWAAVSARLGWIVVLATAAGFVAGLVTGRLSRRPGAAESHRSRSGSTAAGAA